ncbi:MAG: DUF4892 domain-containing protein, partial [Desulfofustis sp.]|nr:DUF4892 domain-containing protein [Desulfofustis sp.]
MRKKRRFFVVAFLCLMAAALAGGSAHADIEGSADHPAVKRYEGAEIIKYNFQEYSDLTIALGKARNSSEIEEEMRAEGAVTRLTYKIPLGRSPLEVVRNYEQDLQADGFTVLFGGSTNDLGSYFAEAA